MYTLKLSQFEGPLDLLLELIEEKKLNVSEISLAEVADQYLAYIKSEDFARSCTSQEMHLAHIADFLVIAARLLLIKSRALLPSLSLTEEEEGDIKELESRLEEYRIFKDAAKKLGIAATKSSPLYGREFLVGFKDFLPPTGLTSETLRDTVLALLTILEESTTIKEETIALIVSFEETLETIKARVLKEAFSFHEIGGQGGKSDTIVAFLAILELAKQKFIIVEQEEIFRDIRIKKAEHENVKINEA